MMNYTSGSATFYRRIDKLSPASCAYLSHAAGNKIWNYRVRGRSGLIDGKDLRREPAHGQMG